MSAYKDMRLAKDDDVEEVVEDVKKPYKKSNKNDIVVLVTRNVIGNKLGKVFCLTAHKPLPEGIEEPFLRQFQKENWVK